ncbi:MAG: hypothetical protein HYX93_02220, partial [Chloroflexi bacterium]|nr:hypothetical protein [Chloroflexota bacterium]
MSYPFYEEEFHPFPGELAQSFRLAQDPMGEWLNEEQFQAWVEAGLGIARRAGRSWEAAKDYFKASPAVVSLLHYAYFTLWAQWGNTMAEESPLIASSYFKAGPDVMRSLKPWEIAEWAQMGRKLHSGNRHSSLLSIRFFEASGDLLNVLSFSEFRHLLLLVEVVAQGSVDEAISFVTLAREVLPSLRDDTRACLSLIATLVKADRQQVTGSLQVVREALARVERVERARFLALTGRLVENSNTHAPTFLREGARALGQTENQVHTHVLDMADALVRVNPKVVPDFIQGVPHVLRRVSINQLETWYDEGVKLLEDNPEGCAAFFRGESAHSQEVLEKLSVGVELGRIKEIMRMYCRALTAINVEISPPPDENNQAKGWVALEKGITEEAVVYLPLVSTRFSRKEDNFDWYKVVTTHQVAHLEFESFLFSLETPSVMFPNLRAQLLSQLDGEGHPPAQGTNGGDESPEREMADIQRFFSLFEDGRLARDIFTAVEDCRLDYRVKVEYAGIRKAYQNVQQQALEERPPILEMHAREAMVELLIRFSLQQGGELMVPERYRDWVRALWEIVSLLSRPQATVEDSAEATIRLYRMISQIPNEEVPQDGWQEDELQEVQQETPQDGQQSEEDLEKMLQQLLESMPQPGEGEQRPYQSPPQVDYRGEFKPEMIQLLALLRESKRQRGVKGDTMTKEEMENLLANAEQMSIKFQEDQLKRLGIFVTETVEELGSKGAPQGAIKPANFSFDPVFDQEEQGGPLEIKEPRSFLYDEWDYRMVDYRPRWCLLREKDMGEGESSFYSATLDSYAALAGQIRRQFELIAPQGFHRMKRMQDGDEFELDAIIEAVIDRRSGITPSEKVYTRRNKVQRDVAVVFLLDMSASTAEAIDESRRLADEWDAPTDPLEYMFWLRTRRGEGGVRRSYKRIVDLEKESLVLLIQALETIGDAYGIYGFSGYGRENVDFYVIKDIKEALSDRVKRRIDKVSPLQATRMGPAIRHAIAKLERQEARTKFFFLISDGRPQDRGYSREGVEKEYAIHDTKVALTEARQKGITPFCLTVDKEGHDYLRTMCQDMGYEVLADIHALPS